MLWISGEEKAVNSSEDVGEKGANKDQMDFQVLQGWRDSRTIELKTALEEVFTAGRRGPGGRGVRSTS